MDHTPRLSLPFLMPGQAQKHITHNEALEVLDGLVQPVARSRSVTVPPATPLEGEAFIVPAGAGGAWAGHTHQLAAWQAGAWTFLDPATGWQVWCVDDEALLVFDGTGWAPLMTLGGRVDRIGVNATADNTNRLTVSAEATLFTHDGAGHQLKLNKAAAADTASLLLQSGWSGRAELGLNGTDSFSIKVSTDGTNWSEALGITPATITAGGSLVPLDDNSQTLGSAAARWSAIWSATGTIQTSDEREKIGIAPSDLGLDFILALEPVRFFWPGDATPHYGLIAQQVLEALAGRPFGGHVLANPDDPASAQGLRYDSLIAPLIQAVQELTARVAALETRP